MCEVRAPMSANVVDGVVAKPSLRAEGWICGKAVRKSVEVIKEVVARSGRFGDTPELLSVVW